MAIQYERYQDEIEAAEEDRCSSDSDDGNLENPSAGTSGSRTSPLVKLTRKQRQQLIFEDRWPIGIGVWLVLVGFISVILGMIQVVVLPLVEESGTNVVHLSHDNIFGLGIWSGILLILVGSCGIRAAMYRSITTMYYFFILIMVNILLMIAVFLLVLVAFSEKWTVPDVYPSGSGIFYVYIANVISLVFGIVLLVIAYTQFYEDVFCGDLQLCKKFCHCCFPCWCPRHVEQEELLQDNNERPPSLPV